MYLLNNRGFPYSCSSCRAKEESDWSISQIIRINADKWTNPDPDDNRCKEFDPDDKKWVALAVRFRKETGDEAPIVNAADRCWLAFEPHLESAGVELETLCRDER